MDTYSIESKEKIEKSIHTVGFILIICLMIFSLFNSLVLGLSWDEYFHHMNGLVRFEYIKTLGVLKNIIFITINIIPVYMIQFHIQLDI